MPSMSFCRPLLALLMLALAACGGSEPATLRAGGVTSSSVAGGDPETLTASTAPGRSSGSAGSSGSPGSIDPLGGGSVYEPGDTGRFVSPSGNIACVMGDGLTSCWISEKQWSIVRPDGPNCEEADWGNAIDLSDEDVTWPCYTDFIYDPDAQVLAYGESMVVAGFRCGSEASGVTCMNAAGQGFRLARAEVVIF